MGALGDGRHRARRRCRNVPARPQRRARAGRRGRDGLCDRDRVGIDDGAIISQRPQRGDLMSGTGTKDDPWRLKTPPLTSDYEMYLDERDGRGVIVCVVGKTTLLYDARAIDDLHAMLKAHGDWIELGSADEQKLAKEGTVEAWGRSADNPVGGWYGLKKGLRGRFGMYMPPLLEALGKAEVEHNPRNNRMRAT